MTDAIYHYTLYYYDQAGNLVQTVPPSGVNLVPDGAFTNGIWDGTEPAHTLKTRYAYNALGQQMETESPDAGKVLYFYDDVQRLRLSQNAQQALDGNYSYVCYDSENRIVRSGQLEGYTITQGSGQFIADLNDIAFPYTTGVPYTTTQESRTYYDFLDSTQQDTNFVQKELRGRVAKVENANQQSYFSYDAAGNVEALYQRVIPINKGFRLDYIYDLVSGKVREVNYQQGEADAHHHRYAYDADLRLKTVETSPNKLQWRRDARYIYYQHGALARVETGEELAGTDYYYTLQGWIVGANGFGRTVPQMPDIDPGRDGKDTTQLNGYFARDQFAFALGYNDSAYIPLATVSLGGAGLGVWANVGGMGSDILGIGSRKGLNNGNIAYMLMQIPKVSGLSGGNFGVAYQYDQLHRIKKGVDYSRSASTWVIAGNFNTSYSYDANGNISQMARAAAGNKMDGLTYSYNANSNQLNYIADTWGDVGYGDLPNQSANNYEYDANGSLVRDVSESLITYWNVQKKVDSVSTPSGMLRYMYDPQGNRLSKSLGAADTTYYVRDAAGNVMAIYLAKSGELRLKERHIYGASRLGVRYSNFGLETAQNPDSLRIFADTVGAKTYEFSNHLGNVLVTLSDKKMRTGAYYSAIVSQAGFYYPFGWEIPTLQYSSGYRYGFNGVEKSPEISGGHNTTFYREQDTRTARWWSFDPRPNPSVAPYAMMESNPILYNDVKGDTFKTANDQKIATDISNQLAQKEKEYEKNAAKLQKRLDKKVQKGKEGTQSYDRINFNLKEAQEGASEMRKGQEEIKKIAASPIIFYFQYQESGNIGYAEGDKEGNIVIKYKDGANMVHELVHAHQHLTGEMELVYDGGKYWDAYDEVAAYKRQYFFSPYSVTGLNFGNIKYKKDPAGNITIDAQNTMSSPIQSSKDITPANIMNIQDDTGKKHYEGIRQERINKPGQ